MAHSTIQREKNSNIVISIEIPWDEVKKAEESVLDQLVEQSDIQGFRKGKAPKKVVVEHADPQKLQEETLRKLLPSAYADAIQQHNIRPMVNPHIHVDKLEEGKAWTITATTCEVPEVKLGDYKAKVKEITAKSKIVIPGKEKKEPSFDEIMAAMLTEVDVTIPQMLIDQEVDRLLAQTLDEIKRLGLSLEQYLSSTGKNPQQLRDDYTKKAQGDIKVELSLQKIADVEKITVSDKEVEEAIQKAKTPQEKANLEQNRYLLASILRQQRTLDFLRDL